jgi:prolipoprotein diacylglyceryltransferase
VIHVPTNPGFHLVFDAAAWVGGAAMARWLCRWRLEGAVSRAAGQIGPGYFAALGFGAVIGGYLTGSLVSFVGSEPVLSHSIAGVLAGAIVGVEVYKAVRGIRGSTGTAFTGALALGIVIGRWGCLFAGLPDNTYGTPTSLPWAVDLGDGVGRHPVQIYESLGMALFLGVYLLGLKRRAPWAMRRGFYVFAAWYGAQRFVWEFLKPYPRLIGGLDLFQLVALGLVAYGWIWFVRDRRDERASGAPAQERALSVPRPDHEPV